MDVRNHDCLVGVYHPSAHHHGHGNRDPGDDVHHSCAGGMINGGKGRKCGRCRSGLRIHGDVRRGRGVEVMK